MCIRDRYTGIFESVNNQVADVAGQVGQTPQGWNGGVFSMIQNLSETVVIPLAGIILTFVLVYSWSAQEKTAVTASKLYGSAVAINPLPDVYKRQA